MFLTLLIMLFTAMASAQPMRSVAAPSAISRTPSSAGEVRTELKGSIAELLKVRLPATYVPRADEFRGDLRQFEKRIMGADQDVSDFMQFRNEMQIALQNFRRMYPHQPLPAEEELKDFYAIVNVSFELFATGPRPESARCVHTVSRLENEFMGENARFDASADDVLLVVRLTEKLCRLR